MNVDAVKEACRMMTKVILHCLFHVKEIMDSLSLFGLKSEVLNLHFSLLNKLVLKWVPEVKAKAKYIQNAAQAAIILV